MVLVLHDTITGNNKYGLSMGLSTTSNVFLLSPRPKFKLFFFFMLNYKCF